MAAMINTDSEHNQQYWEERYNAGETGWDIGDISTPLKAYIDQLQNKDLKILIPGCGNAYEVEYLYKQGFANVHAMELTQKPFENLLRRMPDFPTQQLIHGDFFAHAGQYDLILEQTFFSAIEPRLRPDYAQKTHELLATNGKLVGVLFNCELGSGPPYGGTKEEYETYFRPYFNIRVFEESYNSIEPREGIELFINLEKK
ncbi:hypothetical protein [Sulfuriflexus mobilis]|uniref:hypothetical protein n=1 Tax=Sulfuriflexus mobilis TaxID=1811807 RepID=UPI0018D5908C|nr:hypothetical protein [Sulfuriflexus mobilis]